MTSKNKPFVNKLGKFLAAIFALSTLFAPLTSYAQTAETAIIHVVAERNIAIPLSQIATTYTRTHGISINVTSANAEAMQEQISNGEAVDIVISAYPPLFENLSQQGLSDNNSRAALASDKLAFVGGAQTPITLDPANHEQTLAMLQQANPRWQLDTNISQGYWADKWAQKAALTTPATITTDMFALSYALNRPTLEAPLSVGIGFASDIRQHADLKVLQPIALEQAIQYEGVVVAGEQMKAARELLQFLTAPTQKQKLQTWLDNK